MPRKAAAPFVLSDALLSAYDTNDQINQYLLESLPEEAWRAEPPGKKAATSPRFLRIFTMCG